MPSWRLLSYGAAVRRVPPFTSTCAVAVVAVLVQLAAGMLAPAARADVPRAVAPPARVLPAVTDPEEDLADELDDLAARVDMLEARLKQSEALRQASGLKLHLSGYGDIGLFVATGDGSGVRRDVGYVTFPEYSNFAWVFYGDLLAPQVNSRGEAADLGQLPGVSRFDSVHAGDNATFLVNELNLTLNAALGTSALFTASVNLVPRTGTQDFSLGDFIDVDLVQLEWLPTDDQKHSIFVGKVDSVLGIEYKARKASQRFDVVPTLLARYTTGTAIGVKARSKLFDDHVIVALAVTNGSFGTEQFHFYREVDTNSAKTVSGRLAWRQPIGDGEVEIGASGQAGTQDGGPDGSGVLWFAGGDLQVIWPSFELHAQYLRGKSPGDEGSGTYALDLKHGAYAEALVRIGPIFGVLARGELRDALVSLGSERMYVTKVWRAVAALHLTLGPQLVLKVEGVHNGEYGRVPEFPDDVLTSSLVISY